MRFILFAAVVGLQTFSSSAYAESNQFDLICSGTSSGFENGEKTAGPFSQTLHVDLIRNEYCIDSCSEIRDIQRVDPLKITFVDVTRNPSELAHYRDFASVERTTGKYSVAFMDSGKLKFMTVDAVCKPAPFTPFPATKF